MEERRKRLERWRQQAQASKSKSVPLKFEQVTAAEHVANVNKRPRLMLKQNVVAKTGTSSHAKSANYSLDLDTALNQLEANYSGALDAVEGDSDEDTGLSQDQKKAPAVSVTKIIPKLDVSGLVPFRKTFYIQPEGINVTALRQQYGLAVRNCSIAPITKWEAVGIAAPILEYLKSKGLTEPTPIQAQCLPVAMAGRDIIGVAQTGSGKTLAFLLPLVRHVRAQQREPGDGPVSIVLAPTRELVAQIYSELSMIAPAVGLSATACYGGTDVKIQISSIRRGTDILVGTPGRVIDLLTANGGRVTNGRRTSFVVVDETDRMFDMGFEPQVRRIIEATRPDRQTLLFSATLSKRMERLSSQITADPVRIVVGVRSAVAASVRQEVEQVRPENKVSRLIEVLNESDLAVSGNQAIIFVDKQDNADQLALQLVRNGYICTSLHGGKDQEDRDSAIADFRDGKLAILVATSVAARGLDVERISLVVNFDPPSHLEDYVHRVGRTGRAGRKGRALTLLLESQTRQACEIARAFKTNGLAVPCFLQTMADSFSEQVKNGVDRFHSGFGGKGLARLQMDRQEKQRILRAEYGQHDEEEAKEIKDESPAAPIPIISPVNPVVTRTSTGYEAVLPINDYPQKARQAVTSFAKQSRVIEAHGVAITNRGTFNATQGEKLHLLIEGPTEQATMTAYDELVQLLHESSQPSRGGRYTI